MFSDIAPFLCLGLTWKPGTDYNDGIMCDSILEGIIKRWIISKPYLYEGVPFARTSAN